MVGGKYYAFKRSKEIEATTMFTNNLQVSLSVFAFSAFIVSVLWWCVGRLPMLNLPTWIFHPLTGAVAVLLIGFFLMAMYSLYLFLKLLWSAWRGQVIHYDPKNTPPETLKAIKPIIDNNKDLREYGKLLKRLIDEKNELISDYQSVIKTLEVKNGGKHKSA